MTQQVRSGVRLELDAITIDPGFAELIPLLQHAEFEQLEANIRRNGMRDALVVWPNDEKFILLDGHNRYRIMQNLSQMNPKLGGMPYDVETLQLESREAANLWIEENQIGKRNLTDDQRAMIWASILERRERLSRINAAEIARAAKAANSVADETTATVRKPREEEKAAQESGLPVSKLRIAKKIRKASPEAAEAVRSGRRTLRQAKREMRVSLTFLPDLAAGDEVAIARKDEHLLSGIATVDKVTSKLIHVRANELVAAFRRECGHQHNGDKSLQILRIATVADRQELADRFEEWERRKASLQASREKFRELMIRIPTEFRATGDVYSNGKTAVSTLYLTDIRLEHFERLVEALQLVPHVAR